MYLATNILGLVEERLTKLHNEGCRKLMVLLSTYGGEITFPEAFISRVRDMGFEKIYTFVLDIAFSAGTLLALLSDMIKNKQHQEKQSKQSSELQKLQNIL
jgi:membrane-bound ClpP family serine protease